MDWRDKAAQPKQTQSKTAAPQESHYSLLGLHPSASAQEIRSAYRELSKRYHPDTTQLAADVATAKFQQLNQAYAVLSSPERRLLYDQSIGYSRIAVVQTPPDLHKATVWGKRYVSSSAYLDPTDRPLSPGEIFALFILGLTVLGCLVLAIAIGITRGNSALQPVPDQPSSSLTITVTKTITHSTIKQPQVTTGEVLSLQALPVGKSAPAIQPSHPANASQPIGQPVPSTQLPQATVHQPTQLADQLPDQPNIWQVDPVSDPSSALEHKPVTPSHNQLTEENKSFNVGAAVPSSIPSSSSLAKPTIPSKIETPIETPSIQQPSTGLSTETTLIAEPVLQRLQSATEVKLVKSASSALESKSVAVPDRPPSPRDNSDAAAASPATTTSKLGVTTPAA